MEVYQFNNISPPPPPLFICLICSHMVSNSSSLFVSISNLDFTYITWTWQGPCYCAFSHCFWKGIEIIIILTAWNHRLWINPENNSWIPGTVFLQLLKLCNGIWLHNRHSFLTSLETLPNSCTTERKKQTNKGILFVSYLGSSLIWARTKGNARYGLPLILHRCRRRRRRSIHDNQAIENPQNHETQQQSSTAKMRRCRRRYCGSAFLCHHPSAFVLPDQP